MIQVTTTIAIDESEIRFDFIRASKPGGQNVNKVATAVQLRFNLGNNTSLSEDVKSRLISLAGSKVNSDGILIIKSQRHRTQYANRKDAIHRFKLLIEQAAIRPKVRLKRAIPARVNEKRLADKKIQSRIKRIRRVEWD